MATLPSDTISASLESALLRFSHMVRRVGARHGLRGADVDDLVQEVRIRLWRAGDSGERIAGLGTSYVYRTAMTAAVDLIRGRRRGMNALLEPESRRSDLVAVRMQRAPDELLEDLELGAAIEAAIESCTSPAEALSGCFSPATTATRSPPYWAGPRPRRGISSIVGSPTSVSS
jgi:DNA-directed RNA polymerase specialized sigma24 family protein